MNTAQEMDRMYRDFGISPEVAAYGRKIEALLKERFDALDQTAEYNQWKVINAMQKNRVNAECLSGTTGYGYDDFGRDTLTVSGAKPLWSGRRLPAVPTRWRWP